MAVNEVNEDDEDDVGPPTSPIWGAELTAGAVLRERERDRSSPSRNRLALARGTRANLNGALSVR